MSSKEVSLRMKLILVFNKLAEVSKKNEIGSNDHIICNGNLDDYEKCYDINDTSINFEYYRDEWDKAITNYFLTNSLSSFQKDLILSSALNFFMHNYRFLLMWIETVKSKVDSNNYDEVVFSDYIKLDYLPYYEAEGEINKQLFYKKFDFIPFYLFKFLEKSYPNLKLRILNNKSKIELLFRVFTRRYVLLCLKFLLHLSNILKNKKTDDLDNSNLKILILSRGIAHTNYVKGLLELNQNIFLHASDGMFSKNANTEYAFKINKSRLYTQYNYLSFADLTEIFWNLFTNLFNKRIPNLDLNLISLNFNSLIKEMIIAQLEVDLHVRSVYNVVSKVKSNFKIITCEMISQYPLWLNRQFEINKNVKVLQLQTTSLDLFPVPNFVHTDAFLFKSTKDLDYFKNLFPNESDKLKFYGNLSYNNKSIIKTGKELKNLIYLTQPYELDNQISIIKYLVQLASFKGFNLFVKPHPRENLKQLSGELSGIGSKISFLDKDIDLNSLRLLADLVILRTSSMSQDLYLNRIPTINVLLTNFDVNLKAEYLVANQPNVVKSLVDLENLINNYSIFLTEFLDFSEYYQRSVGINKGVLDFNNEILI